MQISDGIPEEVRLRSPELVSVMLNGKGRKNILESWAGVTNESQEQKSAMVSEFLSTLRWLVDQWIDSGKKDGVENVWERSIHWHSDAHSAPLAVKLRNYEIRNPVEVLFGPDSRSEIGMLPASVRRPELWGLVYPLVKAQEKAVFWLWNLVNCPSPARERLSRCDGCGEYFVRSRAPKKEMPIYHGAFCANCKGKGGARRTVESRKLRTKRMIEWAADAWAKWKPGNRSGDRSDWIVKQVNVKLLAGQNPIKVNWVTRHLTEIKAEVERRNHAKG